ncbi:MAG: hypothetical protein PHE56_14180 [Bacteroidales bacterium]|nr:hypothetical protein [Bacteroidales bacterium]
MKNLDDIEKKNAFKVPDDYFENLEKNIAERIKTENPAKKVSLYQIFKPYIYMAASIIVLGYGLKTVLSIVVDKPVPPVKTQTEEVAYEVDDLISEISSDDITLYEYLNEDESETAWASAEIINSDEDLAYVEDYLSQYYLEYEMTEE